MLGFVKDAFRSVVFSIQSAHSVLSCFRSCEDSKSSCDVVKGPAPKSGNGDDKGGHTTEGCENGSCKNREAIRKYTNGRYRATSLLVLTVITHTLLCLPFIVNQFLSFFKNGFYPGKLQLNKTGTLMSALYLKSAKLLK